jgi:hypothetical protein
VRVVLGFILLLLPGVLAVRWFVPDAGVPEILGMGPALSAAMLSVLGIFVLAAVRTPFTSSLAFSTLAIGIAIGIVAFVVALRRVVIDLRT